MGCVDSVGLPCVSPGAAYLPHVYDDGELLRWIIHGSSIPQNVQDSAVELSLFVHLRRGHGCTCWLHHIAIRSAISLFCLRVDCNHVCGSHCIRGDDEVRLHWLWRVCIRSPDWTDAVWFARIPSRSISTNGGTLSYSLWWGYWSHPVWLHHR